MIFVFATPGIAADEKSGPDEGNPATINPERSPLPAGAIARLGQARDVRQNKLLALVFAPDGRSLISLGSEKICFWDTTNWNESRAIQCQQSNPCCMAISVDGKILATGDLDCKIWIWQISTGKELGQLVGNRSLVAGVSFSLDGKTLVSAGYDHTVRVWDVANGKELRQFKGHYGPVQRVAVSPDGKTLASFCTDASTDDHAIRLWDFSTGKELRQIQLGGPAAFCSAFSPDSRTLACGGGFPGRLNASGDLRLWDTITGKELRNFVGHQERVTCVAISSDGKTLASGSIDGTVRLWELATGRERRRFDGHVEINTLAFSPDGLTIASGQVDNSALVWDISGPFRQKIPAKLSYRDLEDLWAHLEGKDGARACQAISTLTLAPRESVPFLNQNLQPVSAPVDEKRIDHLIRGLNQDDFREREKCSQDLRELDDLAEPALRKCLQGKPSPEVRHRVELRLLEIEQNKTPRRIRALRAIEVLEHIGSKEAQEVLNKIAKGAPQSRMTQEARASLARLGKR
jgi:WD40 repeat protein